MTESQGEPKAMPLKVAELLYSFLWLEFRGRPVTVGRLQDRFKQMMRRSLNEFVSWFPEVKKVQTVFKEYHGILFDYVPHSSREEDGKKYPSYYTVCPLRNVDGMPITGIRVLTELEEKRLLKRLPDADSFVDVTKLDFDLISREVGADRFSVMAATFWHIGYESRPEPNRTLSSAEVDYAGHGFVGICARSTDLDRKGKCEVRYVLAADDDGLGQPVQVTLLVDNAIDRINGEMVFGCFEDGDGRAVLYDGDLRFVRIVTWHDFLESERFETFEEWLDHDNGQGLFPFFKSSTRDIIILDAYLDDENEEDRTGSFYLGLTMDFNLGRVFVGKLHKTVHSDFLYHDEIKEVLDTSDKWTPKNFGDETTSFVCSGDLASAITKTDVWQQVSVKGITEFHKITKETNMQKNNFIVYNESDEFESCIGIYKKKGNKDVVVWAVSKDLLPLYRELEFQIQADRHKEEQDWLIDGMLIEVVQNGRYLNGGNIDGMYRGKYVEIRKWEDFEEARSCGCSFEEYINGDEEIFLTPKFKYLTPSIIVEAPNEKGRRCLYVGFSLKKDRRYVCGEIIVRSEFTWEEYSREQSTYFHVVGGYDRTPKRNAIDYHVFECGVGGESERFILIDIFKSDPGRVHSIIESASSGSQNGKYRWTICKKPKTAEEQERQFVKGFIEYATKACGFTYDERDLIRFHTAVKCGRMTLLGGAPGCGKSKMVEIYARSLCGDKYSDMCKLENDGKDIHQTFLRVDVNPAWLEPSDIMGYYSPSATKDDGCQYHSATCGLKEFLGQRPVEVPELICFEEMNLARIEFYFSEFMQMLSRDTLELPTYGLTLREGTRFVGTFNDDATTQRMSSRFLDRCSVIMLGDVSDDERPFALKRGKVSPRKGNGISAAQYRKWIKGVGDISDDVVNKTNDLYQKIIQGVGSKKANNTDGLDIKPSPRVREEILLYIVNRIFLDENSLDENNDHVLTAFDEAFAQRVISKFSPNPLNEKKYAKLAKVLKDVLGEKSISARMADVLQGQSHAVAMWSEEEDVVEKMS